MADISRRCAGLFALLAFPLALAGCMGWGDIFAEKRTTSGDYFMMQGGMNPNDEIYLFVKGNSSSIAGYIHQIGWSQEYIIFTDQNWPKPWNVIDVHDHRKFTISDSERTSDKRFSKIQLMSPANAWKNAKH
jgi:hypothetical protein